MSKRVMQMEEDFEGTETKLAHTSTKLAEATKACDDSTRSVSNFLDLLTAGRAWVREYLVDTNISN